jgi:hypothetical protein
LNGKQDNNKVLVLGGGRFGKITVERLGSRAALVVEPNPTPELKALGVEILVADGIAASVNILDSPQAPPWLVPALPLHFLMEWLFLCLADLAPQLHDIPENALPKVAMRHAGSKKEWYLSMADFVCPDDCPEPARICTQTGEPRQGQMFEMLAQMRMPGSHTRVLRSHQLAPGVGALARQELLDLRAQIIEAGSGSRWVIGTACRCHGVVQAMQLGGTDG